MLDWIGTTGVVVVLLVMVLMTTLTKKVRVMGYMMADWGHMRSQILDKLDMPRGCQKKANLSCCFAAFKSTPQQDIEDQKAWEEILMEMAVTEKT